MNSWMAFGTIVAIIAIALLGGALIAVIAHMILGTFSGEKTSKKSKEVVDYGEVKQLENAKEEEYDFDRIDEAKAEKEKEELENAEDNDVFELDAEDEEGVEDTDKVEEETVEEEDEDDLGIDELIDQISDEVATEEQENIEETNSTMSDELASYSIDQILNEDEEEEGTATEEPVEEPVEEAEDVQEEAVQENNEDKETIAKLKAELAELNKKLEEARTVKAEAVSVDMTEEQCLARLQTLEDRLKNAKRDYKINSKEYRPIKKVMNDYEKYQAKLTRKNAIVANKKISLYGVSNYVDLDKEKAEKLNNELDHLTGLRLSVQHCEEVINANKDRFPILERTNNILEEEIANIEADIEATNKTLQLIRDKKNK